MSTVPETEYVAAGDVQPGDRLIYGAVVVEVAGRPVTAAWMEGGERVHGVEIECRDLSGSGTARLFLYRRRSHMLERIAGADLCPLAKVPCSPNAFDMCRYCGRDLSGNPDE